MKSLISVVLPLVVALIPAGAQSISGTITPPIAAPGQQVTLTITGIQGVILPDPCIPDDIRIGGPSGTVLVPDISCGLIIVPLAPGQVVSAPPWTVPASAAPGSYWMRVRYFTATATIDEYFCLEVRTLGASGPTLAALSLAQVGQTLVLSLNDAASPGAPYIVAASFTSTVGLSVGGSLSCLDADALFALSFPAPFPGLFNGFQGVLDATGGAGAISVAIPNDPVLDYFPLKLQAAIGNPSQILLTNALNVTIAP
jgi:hypothetical protein